MSKHLIEEKIAKNRDLIHEVLHSKCCDTVINIKVEQLKNENIHLMNMLSVKNIT